MDKDFKQLHDAQNFLFGLLMRTSEGKSKGINEVNELCDIIGADVTILKDKSVDPTEIQATIKPIEGIRNQKFERELADIFGVAIGVIVSDLEGSQYNGLIDYAHPDVNEITLRIQPVYES